MMAANTASHESETLDDIKEAVEELQWVEYAARPHHNFEVIPEMSPQRASQATDTSPAAVGRILVATDGRTVHELALYVGRIIVGRTPANDLQVDSRYVSRNHCQIVTTANSCVIEDLHSTTGIYEKSKSVHQHKKNDGDVVV